MPKESLLASMPKLILAVVLIVCIGAVMGLMGWALTREPVRKANEVDLMKVINKCSYCKTEFALWCQKCNSLSWSTEPISMEGDIHKCMRDCFNTNFPFSTTCLTVKRTCEELDIIKIEKDETANWQTYRNEEFGFEIKYPSEFSLTEEHLNFVHFEKGNRYWMSVKVENRNNKSIDQWIESDRDGRKDFPYTKIRNINIDSIDTVIVLEPMTEGEDYYRSFIPVGDKMLIFEYAPGYIEYQSAEFYQAIDEFNQILSTFKFIEK